MNLSEHEARIKSAEHRLGSKALRIINEPSRRSALLALLALIVSVPSARGQGYPQVPAEIMKASQAERAEAAKHSDEAFQRALPEIEAGAAKGKPYIPGAAKPEDLP